MAIDKNSPCPCGSGKKYKKCCLNNKAELSDSNTLIDKAFGFHTSGRLTEAEAIYREILTVQPDHAKAIHALGVIGYQKGQHEEAIRLIKEAVRLDPDNLEFRNNLELITKSFEKTQRNCPSYLDAEVYDRANERVVKRYFPLEESTFIYSIDIVGTCNLRCPTCPVGNFPGADRPKGFMDVNLFRDIIEKIKKDNVTENPKIWLFNWGEPLLHSNIEEILTILKDNHLATMISTNLNVERNLKEIVKIGVDAIKISISGFSQQSYSETHARGSIDLVKGNMHLLRFYLDKFKVKTKVWVGHHVYKNNLHELSSMKALVESLGFAYSPIPAFYQPIEKAIDWINDSKGDSNVIDNLLIDPRRAKAIKRNYIRSDLDCEGRFNMMAINHDGSVALCCGVYDKQNMLGINFLDRSHDEIQNMKYSHSFCRQCYDSGLQYSEVDPGYLAEINGILKREYGLGVS